MQQTSASRTARNAAARAASSARPGSSESDLGFHADQHLLALVDCFLPHCANFIETGANLGNTVLYVARKYRHLRAFSCEPGIAAFAAASQRAASVPNCVIRETTSPEFFDDLVREFPDLLTQLNFFHLDAHGYNFHWPLWDEAAWITRHLPRAVILIDDLKIPGRPDFGFDQHEGQICAMDSIRPVMNNAHTYTLLTPTYSDRTSPTHPLRGHGLITFGDVPLHLNEEVKRKYQAETV